MEKTKKVLGLFLVLAMVIGVIAPISVMAYNPGDPFSGSMNFDTVNWALTNQPIPGYNNLGGVSVSVAKEAGVGYSGGYASKINIGAGITGGRFFYIKFPDSIDFSGLKNLSFYAKTNGLVAFRLHSTTTLAQQNISVSEEYVKYTFADLVDPTDFDFAGLRYVRINIPSTLPNATTLYISDLEYSGIRPGEIADPDEKYDEFQMGNFEVDWGNVFPVAPAVNWSTKATDGWEGTKAKLLSFASLSEVGRAGLIIPPPTEYLTYKKIKYMSFLVKNESLTPSTKQNVSFSLRAGDTELYTAPISWNMSTVDEWHNKWVEVNVEITDKTGNGFEGLNRVRITGIQTGGSGDLLFSRLVLSTDPIPPLDLSDKNVSITSVKVNNVENPTVLTSGLNTVQIVATNTTDSDVSNAVLVVGVYEKTSGKLVAVGAGTGNIIVDLDNTLSASVTVPSNAQNYELKAFLWDGATSIQPITDTIITI